MNERFALRHFPTLFTTAEAGSYGISEWNLRRGNGLANIASGVWEDHRNMRLRAVPPWADERWIETSRRLRALLLKYPSLAASHSSAILLHGLPLPFRRGDDRLHVATTDPNLRIRRKGVALHRVVDFESEFFLGNRLVTGPGLFFQVSEEFAKNDLIRLGDAMIGRWHGPPLCSQDDLIHHLESAKYVRNRALITSAVDLIRPDVDSPKETDLRLWLLSIGFPEPEIHPAVYSHTERRELHPDLGYSAARLGIEYEGEQHLMSKDQWNRDISRVNAMIAEGWYIIRVASGTDYRTVAQSIRSRLIAAGYQL